jgi:polyphenol oxidase
VIELGLPGAQVVFTDRTQGDVREPARRQAAEAIAGRPLAYGRQVHGAVVRRVRVVPADIDEADGQATPLADVAPAVLVADCLPIALAGEDVVAMLHGGWRGLAAGIVEEGVRAARELGAGGPLSAAIGPGARGCCYEVGPEVHAVFGTAGPTLDLATIATERLRAAGVEAIADTGVCTICDEQWFSHRREGAAAGRQAGIVWRV